jgi:hypothetical protein
MAVDRANARMTPTDSPAADAEPASLSASCLCGAVSLTIQTAPDHVDACHCSMCRKWGGSPAMGFPCDELKVSGEDAVTIYPSSDWAERAFCSTCGTHLYYRLKGRNQYFVPIGFFQQCNDVAFTEEIFYDEKPDFYSFANATTKMTGQEAFAKYAALG